ncbi:single-stranded-DNA-specific exonuclease RecJ [Paenibacillus tarimensis]
MLHPKTRWMLEEENEVQMEQAKMLASELSLPPLVARLLVKRGITETKQARSFLYGGMDELHDPFLLKGMTEAVQRILLAKERGEKVRIYGDYDADGVSSTSFMIRLFTLMGIIFDYYIPHRKLEGYGLNMPAIEQAAKEGVSLLVTVDTGISAARQIEYARSLQIDVIVTDHHEPPETLPDAYAVVNPKQSDCPYPYKGLAGAGVAFKLGQALLGRPPLEWAEITALGTIADLMPLTGENRIIVRHGLEQMRNTVNPGIRALAEVAGIDLAAIVSSNVAFGMAPRINASGRLEHADSAVRLLTTNDPEEALACSVRLDRLNKERQRIVDEMVEQALMMWQDKCNTCAAAGGRPPSVIVLAAEGWNVGVIGIVASKLIEKFYRPAIVFGIDAETGMCKGSARSIDGFDLYAALTECAETLDHYGGHQAAAGMSLHRDKLPELERQLGLLADEWLAPDDWVRKTAVDAECGVDEAGLDTIGFLSLLEPFGTSNPAPKLLFRKVEVEESRAMGKGGKHLRLSLLGQSKRLDAVSFGTGELARRLAQGAKADIVGELSVNEWNGSRKPQLMLHDLRVEHVQLFDYRNEENAEQLVVKWLEGRMGTAEERRTAVVLTGGKRMHAETAAAGAEGEATANGLQMKYIGYEELPEQLECTELIVPDCPPSAALFAKVLRACSGVETVAVFFSQNRRQRAGFPGREHFGKVYQAIRQMGSPELRLSGLHERLSSRIGWSVDTIRLMLDVFAELGFILYSEGNVIVNPTPTKRDLSESDVYRLAKEQFEEDRVLFGTYREFADWILLQTGGRT